jgi:hypothetical protein
MRYPPFRRDIDKKLPLLKEQEEASAYHPLIFQIYGSYDPSVGVGTGLANSLLANWLPRRHRAVPSASLDKSEY